MRHEAPVRLEAALEAALAAALEAALVVVAISVVAAMPEVVVVADTVNHIYRTLKNRGSTREG
jgi:hypothetical protein